MLEISSISWKNFLSYGDYTTTLDIENLGQCLITGEVVDSETKEAYNSAPLGKIRRSNGAGKSTIPSVVQWVLFGRTMHSTNPGDKIVNWYTGKNCWAQIKFKNGDSITRTRNTNGHNELIVVKDGDESKFMAETLSTAKNQQLKLVRMFDLDWDIFCGSTFFSQYGKPWMEMADQARKKALERLLHIDRFTYYAKIAKDKCTSLDNEVSKLNVKKTNIEDNISKLDSEIQYYTDKSERFAQMKLEAIADAKNRAKLTLMKRDEIKLVDIDKLENRWKIVEQITAKIDQLKSQANELNRSAASMQHNINQHQSTIKSLESKLKLWNDRGGKMCMSCEQEIPHHHTSTKTEPIINEINEEKKAIDKIVEEQKKLTDAHNQSLNNIKNLEEQLKSRMPQIKLSDAYREKEKWQHLNIRYNNELEQIPREEKLVNPYDDHVARDKESKEQALKELAKINDNITKLEILNKHYSYINKAYNDRSKIKGFIFKEHVPFINNRLKHYLDAFGLDVKIELTDSLSISSNMWGYEFESGGERKRTDVAFMLAIFDFHEHMYGRQCNLLVLDEVDGRLDDDGIDSLINIIKNDLSNRVESVLIISHRDMMHDTFPREIKVVRKDRFSNITVN